MNKLQNLEKSLSDHLKDAKDIEAFRMNLRKSISEKQYSWFELFYEQDKRNKDFVNMCEKYIHMAKPKEKDMSQFPITQNQYDGFEY